MLCKTANGDLPISRTALLFDCFTKWKQFFDTVLALPFESMQYWSILEWRELHHVVISISKMLPHIGQAVWHDDSTNARAKFDYFLECLCSRVRDLDLLTNCAVGQKTGFQQILYLWDVIRSSNRASLDLVAAPVIPAMNWQGVGNTQPYAEASEQSQVDYASVMDFRSFDLAFQNAF
jgi:hypothetical protein